MVGESFLGPASLAWAKPGDESGYLSVWQHLVDTRDVASRLWDTFVADSIKQSLATTERLEVSEVRALAVFWQGSTMSAKSPEVFSARYRLGPTQR